MLGWDDQEGREKKARDLQHWQVLTWTTHTLNPTGKRKLGVTQDTVPVPNILQGAYPDGSPDDDQHKVLNNFLRQDTPHTANNAQRVYPLISSK